MAGLAVVLLAAWARGQTWVTVFTAQGITFVGDTDPHYHLLRAQRILAQWPVAVWTDPNLNFPAGAEIFWPPLFDYAIALPAVLLYGKTATLAQLGSVAAILPAVLGVLGVLLVAAMGRVLLGSGPWWASAATVALLPSAVAYSAVGRPDQHVLEVLLLCLVLLTWFLAWRAPKPFAWALGLGVVLAASFWNWQGSAFTLVVLCAFAALNHLLEPEGPRRSARVSGSLALGTAFAAVLLVVSIALWAFPGALGSLRLAGISGLSVLLCGAAASFAGLLRGAIHLRRGPSTVPRRLAELTAAVALPLVAALVGVPGVTKGAQQGLLALFAGNEWYLSIQEFQPLVGSGDLPLRLELVRLVGLLGLGIAFLLLGLVLAFRRWKAQPKERLALLFLLYWGGAFLLLSLLRFRFVLYLAPPLAVGAWFGIRELGAGSRLSSRLALYVGSAGLLLGPAIALGGLSRLRPGIAPATQETLEWLRSQPASEERPAVMAPWNLGHAVLYVAKRPVISSPFGTEGGEGAMEAAAAFYFAQSAQAAVRVLDQRQVGWVLLANPLDAMENTWSFAPAGSPKASHVSRDLWKGRRSEVSVQAFQLAASRLYYGDGALTPGSPAFPKLRLLYESQGAPPSAPLNDRRLKLFGYVQGAVLEAIGGKPGATLTASTWLVTNQGRRFLWSTSTPLNAQGSGQLELPYASGLNGAVQASAWTITDGATESKLEVSELQVLKGERLRVPLGAELP